MQLRAEELDPGKAMESCRCPVLLLAGDSERVLKLVEIEYLYGCIPEPKRMVLFPGAGHEDLFSHDPRRYARAVEEFLAEFAPAEPAARGARRVEAEAAAFGLEKIASPGGCIPFVIEFS